MEAMRPKAVLLQFFIVLWLFASNAHGYSRGNMPSGTCNSMVPGHGTSSQTDTEIRVSLSKTIYAKNDRVLVTVTSSAGPFLGKLLHKATVVLIVTASLSQSTHLSYGRHRKH